MLLVPPAPALPSGSALRVPSPLNSDGQGTLASFSDCSETSDATDSREFRRSMRVFE